MERRHLNMHKEAKVLNKWVSFGYSFKQFSLGFTIDKYHMNADFVFFWVGVEW